MNTCHLPIAGDIVLFKEIWFSAGDKKRIGAGDCTWALMADVGIKDLKGEKDCVGVAADSRECAPADSTGVGWWRMLLKCNSAGWSTCVGDSGQSCGNEKMDQIQGAVCYRNAQVDSSRYWQCWLWNERPACWPGYSVTVLCLQVRYSMSILSVRVCLAQEHNRVTDPSQHLLPILNPKSNKLII